MLSKFELVHIFLFVVSVYLNCILTLDVPPDHVGVKDLTEKGNPKPSTNQGNGFSVNKKSDHMVEIPVDKLANDKGETKNKDSESDKETSRLVLEGGGIVDLTSTAQPNINVMDIGMVDDGTHSKGSKPRKGVQHPGSSVVPRKGVDLLGAFNLSQPLPSVTSDPIKESTNAILDGQLPSNKTEPPKVELNQGEQQPSGKSMPKVHPKKPVVVTDIEDVDDFDKYPIIQTSTTGEDYIIIGIVIVLGIWCSIFGALIFYRRAGEYWDRRHYRRMDFLVEGMYND